MLSSALVVRSAIVVLVCLYAVNAFGALCRRDDRLSPVVSVASSRSHSLRRARRARTRSGVTVRLPCVRLSFPPAQVPAKRLPRFFSSVTNRCCALKSNQGYPNKAH